MAQNFHLKNIRRLLIQGFTDEELRLLCYDNPEFRSVYDEQLAEGMGKGKIVQELIAYAERRELMETLLRTTQELNPASYKKHQPYYSDRAQPTTSAKMPPGIPPPPKPYEEHPYPAQAHFTGRRQERDALTAWLNDDEHPLQAIIAIGGMGKSALSWHWLQHDLVEQGLEQWGLDGVLWWSFYDQASGFERFLERAIAYTSSGQIDTTGWSTRERMDALRTLLQEKRFLVILDGAERLLRAYARIDAAYIEDPTEDDVGAHGDTPDDAVGAYGHTPDNPAPQESPRQCAELNVGIFLPWLAGLKPSKTLLTSRLFPRELEGLAGVIRTDLTHINPEDAVTFFRAMGIRGTRNEIQAACEPYGYLPLALRLLGGLVAEDPVRPGDIAVATEYEIAEDLRGKERHHILERAYNALDTEGQELLSRIAAFRAMVEYEMVRTLFGPTAEEDSAWRFPSERALKDTLRRLLRRGLLFRQEGTSRYDLHLVVRGYAYDRLADKEGTHSRLRDYFAAISVPERVEKLEELAPVIELYHHTVRAGQYDETMRLLKVRLIPNPLYFQFGAYQLCIELLRTFFPDGEDHPPCLKDEQDQGWTLSALGSSYNLSGQPSRAIQLGERQIAMDEKQGNKKNLVIGLGNIGRRHMDIGALQAAETNLRRSITLAQEIENEFGEAAGYLFWGRLMAYQGAWDEAQEALTTALAMFEKGQKVQAQGITWAYHALKVLLQGRVVKAITNLTDDLLTEALTAARRALELADEGAHTDSPVERDYVQAHWLLGAAHRANDNLAQADDHLTEALTRCRRINLVEVEGDILLSLARLRAAQGQREEALSLAQEALLITERSGYVLQGADVHLFLAQMALEEGDKAKARPLAQRAHQLATCDGPPDYTYKVAYDEAEALLAQLG